MRRRAAIALLMFVAGWPAVTLVLQSRWDVDPWKLMSFGMYAAPARRVDDTRLTLEVRCGGRWEQTSLDAEAAHFLRWRRTLGALISTDRLAQALAASRPECDGTRITIRRFVLDPKTARVRVDDERE